MSKPAWLDRFRPPHCDQSVLHRPGTCEFCDTLPELQDAREMWGINFTGEKDPNKAPCPSERRRSVEKVHAWPGNRPSTASPPFDPPGSKTPATGGLYDYSTVDQLVTELKAEATANKPPPPPLAHLAAAGGWLPGKIVAVTITNGGVVCDALDGAVPCACGAWHKDSSSFDKGNKVTLSGKPADPSMEGKGAPQPIDPKTGMHGDYWVLSPEERAKGFVRPVRRSYRHVGIRPKYATRPLTEDEAERYKSEHYVCYETYPKEESPITGRFWRKRDLESGCRTVTTMGLAIAETYARNPQFYGSTYCAGCGSHFPVGAQGEFVWEGTDERVGT